ncbi:hypothetical protein PR202_ga09285 [Eleusine coracana subsp. coracana]|uniref:AP2/ERF domain-containing protein n=1 Tax=Eleusine coracana subsp. coracana TaxID=191504 RepID=A0AAV5C3D8_ELECO|nr:hypothetical protein PR202_ga09285 [Eleusine coracana subsp. coracana]
MRKPTACSLSPPSSLTSSSAAFSSVSSAASTSSAGFCYAPPSWTPRPNGKTKRKRTRCPRAKNAGAIAVPRTRSSVYRGVTRHKGSGKFEAHLWDANASNPSSKKKGRQGAYVSEEAAARSYDLAALKYWGSRSVLNFPVESYKQEREKMKRMTREGYLATLRRRSCGFSRGISVYRGVAKHHHNGRWEARIGHAGGKNTSIWGHSVCLCFDLELHLGHLKKPHLFTKLLHTSSQEEAARAYDLAAVEIRGRSAITNFDISSYLQPAPRAQPRPPLLPQPKAEPVDVEPLSRPHPTPPLLLQPKPEPEDDPNDDQVAPLPLGPALLDADDVDHAIAEILPALGMDPADFEARYPARRARVDQPDDLRGLPVLPDSVMCFEDDIEALFDAAVADEAQDAASYAAATAISSLASGRWL